MLTDAEIRTALQLESAHGPMLTHAELLGALAQRFAMTESRDKALIAAHLRMVHTSKADHWDDPEPCADACPFWNVYPGADAGKR